jgi:hypothetical protein
LLFDASMCAPPPYDPRYSADWWVVSEAKRNIEQQRQQQEVEEAEVGRRQFYGLPPAS